MVRTISVFAVPGKPVIRQWPPTKRAISIWSSTSSCPTMTCRTWPGSPRARHGSVRCAAAVRLHPYSSRKLKPWIPSWSVGLWEWFLQLQQKFLRGAIAWRGLQCRQNALLRFVSLPKQNRLGQVELRPGLIDGFSATNAVYSRIAPSYCFCAYSKSPSCRCSSSSFTG